MRVDFVRQKAWKFYMPKTEKSQQNLYLLDQQTRILSFFTSVARAKQSIQIPRPIKNPRITAAAADCWKRQF
jgi:hypothetical protein